jgi:hypothetical protein
MWEVRERDKKFDTRWRDCIYNMASIKTVEEFWDVYYHVPLLRCVGGEA